VAALRRVGGRPACAASTAAARRWTVCGFGCAVARRVCLKAGGRAGQLEPDRLGVAAAAAAHAPTVGEQTGLDLDWLGAHPDQHEDYVRDVHALTCG